MLAFVGLFAFLWISTSAMYMPPSYYTEMRGNGLPERVLKHPDAEYASDTVRAKLADEDERFSLFDRNLYYDIPKDQRFKSKERATTYKDIDDEISHNTYLRRARLDDYNGPNLRQFERREQFENKPAQQFFSDQEKGEHMTALTGHGVGSYRRNLGYILGPESGKYNRVLDYRYRPGFDENDDGSSLPGRLFFTNRGRFPTEEEQAEAAEIAANSNRFGIPNLGNLKRVGALERRLGSPNII